SAAGEHYGGTIRIYGARDPALFSSVEHFGFAINGAVTAPIRGSGTMRTAQDNDAIRLVMESGNIRSGTFILMGLKSNN
ncbi:MAG: hypothetical protein ACE5H7_11410, partial [Acidiferrobacterales bacterium]